MQSALVHQQGDNPLPDDDDLQAVVDYHCDHLADRNIQLGALGNRLGMSGGHLANKWRAEVGGSIKAHLDQRRARRASHLLAYSDTSINDIAHILAFQKSARLAVFINVSPDNLHAKHEQHEQAQIGLTIAQ